MRERTQAEIEAALTAYHGADGWDENDRADMSYALAAADEVAPPAPVVQKDNPIPYSEIVRELKQLHLSLMSSADAHYRGDAFARAAICIEALEAQKEVVSQSRIEAALRIWYPGVNDETLELLKRDGVYELMGKVLAVGIEK